MSCCALPVVRDQWPYCTYHMPCCLIHLACAIMAHSIRQLACMAVPYGTPEAEATSRTCHDIAVLLQYGMIAGPFMGALFIAPTCNSGLQGAELEVVVGGCVLRLTVLGRLAFAFVLASVWQTVCEHNCGTCRASDSVQLPAAGFTWSVLLGECAGFRLWVKTSSSPPPRGAPHHHHHH